MPKKTEAAPPPLKMPKTLGACADLYGRLVGQDLLARIGDRLARAIDQPASFYRPVILTSTNLKRPSNSIPITSNCAANTPTCCSP